MANVIEKLTAFPRRHPLVAYFLTSMTIALYGAFAEMFWFGSYSRFSSVSEQYWHVAAVGLVVGFLMGGVTSLIGAPIICSLLRLIPAPTRPIVVGIAVVLGLCCTFVTAVAASYSGAGFSPGPQFS